MVEISGYMILMILRQRIDVIINVIYQNHFMVFINMILITLDTDELDVLCVHVLVDHCLLIIE